MNSRSTSIRPSVREPAVAGRFYPGHPGQLTRTVVDFLDVAKPSLPTVPKALIAPHAGYPYSGPIAASAFVHLPRNATIRRVVLLGPSHHVGFQGIALTGASGFATPLGVVPVDREAMTTLATFPQARVIEDAHAWEHSLEVELPFLQLLLDDFTVVPLVTGDASDEEIAQVIEALWSGPETVFVISSDLSHYHDYDTARGLDRRTADAIEHLDPVHIGTEQACGRVAIRGLLRAAQHRGLQPTTIDLRNSGDTAGTRDRVVGYGAFGFAAAA